MICSPFQLPLLRTSKPILAMSLGYISSPASQGSTPFSFSQLNSEIPSLLKRISFANSSACLFSSVYIKPPSRFVHLPLYLNFSPGFVSIGLFSMYCTKLSGPGFSDPSSSLNPAVIVKTCLSVIRSFSGVFNESYCGKELKTD